VAAADDPGKLMATAGDGDRPALARLLSLVERGGAAARAVGRIAHPLGGRAHTVGVTGAPGAGKSTLTGRMVAELRASGDRLAVLAIDPTSPFTGGAILGDRVRMQDHDLDEGVFIRSMATRGHLGGLALAVPEAIRVLDAAGFPWIVVETVGVGQVEVEVAGATDTTIVVLNPGWGDAVQAAKAGLLEIADVFVLNKADRPGVDEAERDLAGVLGLAGGRDRSWSPPIVRAVSTTGAGAEEVVAAVGAHRAHLEASGELERRRAERVTTELRAILVARLLEQVGAVEGDERFAARSAEVLARQVDPWTATDDLLGSAP
jgi:LAO/AO transport system kinase